MKIFVFGSITLPFGYSYFPLSADTQENVNFPFFHSFFAYNWVPQHFFDSYVKKHKKIGYRIKFIYSIPNYLFFVPYKTMQNQIMITGSTPAYRRATLNLPSNR